MADGSGDPVKLRWRLAEDDCGQPALFGDDELLDRHVGRGEYRGLEFLHVNARRVINEVPAASRMPFRYTINAYRGCSHSCAYCFARPTHEYLGLNIGEDFDRRIVVKVNAVERVRAELADPRWCGEPIAMGTNTDPYQRAEGKYRLTRGIVDALVAAENPFSILTKSTLVLGDLDRLAEGARRTSVRANLSVGTLDESVWRTSEPGTPHPRQRVAAVARLNEAGVPCGVLIAPVLPGLSDHPDQLEEVVDACVEAGAVSISTNALHLRPGVREHYLAWLERTHPELVDDHLRRYRRSAYLPTSEQRQLSTLVGRLVDAARARRGGGTRSRRTDRVLAAESRAEPQPEPPRPSRPSSTQLDLGL
ncbi:MAG TPA: radical SAM protein [Acidimicrobiales bacterium]|nr:radical SAM protein [Acidimicrobiales bacterium]